MMRTGVEFEVTDEQRKQLEVIATDGNSKQKHARRAQIILLSDDGLGTAAIMAAAEASKPTVWRWQARFMEEGVEGLLRDKTRKPGKPPVSEAKVGELMEKAFRPPPGGKTHWTVRALAAEIGVAGSTAHRLLARHKVAPNRMRQFKVSPEPDFAEKIRAVAGLYMDPPDRAVVLSINEKTQIQALDRTQKGLPMKSGQPVTMAHDDKWNGITTLFAALKTLDGAVIGRHAERHRHWEFIEFLDRIEAEVPVGRDIHAILDNTAAHKHGAVTKWLAEHPRWIFHYTPTSCTWMNVIESFFGKLARHRLRRDVYKSIEQLERAVLDFIELNNGTEARAFNWRQAKNASSPSAE